MGDWTEIKIGDVEVMHFKDRLPFFAMLIFEKTDLKYDIEKQPMYDEGEHNYKFESTVRKAKQVLDNRGIDEDFCRQTFNELRSETVYDVTQGEDVPNIIDYDIYKVLLKEKIFSPSKIDDGFDEFEKYRGIEEALFEREYPSFFWGENGYAFDDTLHVIYLRTLLAIAPENEVLKLEISHLTNYENMYKNLYENFVQMMLKKIELDYRIYGFVIRNDPNVDIRLKTKIQKLNEDQFIHSILIPLMKAMGFSDVKPVTTHGQGEFGKDIMPFKRVTEFDTIRYFAVQAKAVQIHGSAGRSGNAGELLSQVMSGFLVPFFDGADNQRKRIDEFIIATNQDITSEARQVIENGIEANRKVVFLDIHRIIALVKKYNLTEYVLFSTL